MSASHKNVIEINGKLYDAKSGMLVSNIPLNAKPMPRNSIDVKDVKQPPRNQSIDGVRKKVTRPNVKRHTNTVKIRSPQKSTTLMRQAVKKPSSHTPSAIHTRPVSAAPERMNRATHVQKSPFIHRYGQSAHSGYTKRHENLEVRQAPSHANSTATSAQQHVQSTPHTPVAASAHTTLSKSEQLFNDALAKATTSSKKKNTKHLTKKSHKKLRWISGTIAALLLVGFIGYMNMANINMKIASSRAGFAAAMPSYQPSGYSAGAINYKPGVVTISFNSNTDNRNYTLSQEVSSWNSQTLQENFLTSQNKKFETAQEGGRTIFMYGNGNATWVNGGVWYQVQSSALSSDQLLKIASSL